MGKPRIDEHDPGNITLSHQMVIRWRRIEFMKATAERLAKFGGTIVPDRVPECAGDHGMRRANEEVG